MGKCAVGVALEKVRLFIHDICLLLSTYVIHCKLIEHKQRGKEIAGDLTISVVLT
jgi:hypothetical protein